ncbi:hypothetical protein CB1_000881001 [Camelus ferus]|nr:hypothetical protein CB1_000881001 [Camelus ferus]
MWGGARWRARSGDIDVCDAGGKSILARVAAHSLQSRLTIGSDPLEFTHRLSAKTDDSGTFRSGFLVTYNREEGSTATGLRVCGRITRAGILAKPKKGLHTSHQPGKSLASSALDEDLLNTGL